MTEEQFQERMQIEADKRKADPHYCSCAGGPVTNVCPYKKGKS